MAKTSRRLQSKPHSKAFEAIVIKAKAEKNIPEIEPATLKEILDTDPAKVLLIDVREQNERDQFYIERSIHISRGVLERDIEKTIEIAQSKNRQIITICSGGYRSILAAASLVEMGYTNVSSLAGGLKKYLDQDFDNIVETNSLYQEDETCMHNQ